MPGPESSSPNVTAEKAVTLAPPGPLLRLTPATAPPGVRRPRVPKAGAAGPVALLRCAVVGQVKAGYLVAMVVLVIAYYVLPGARPLTDALIGIASAAAIEYGVRKVRPHRHVGWRCLAGAIVLLTIGDVFYGSLELRSSGPVAYPAPPDIFYLLTYSPLTIGLLVLGRPMTPRRDATTLIDVASVTLAGSLIVWIVLVRPTIEGAQFSMTARVLAVSTWVAYIAVLGAGIRVVLAWRRNRAARLLGAAVAAFLISDFFYGQDVVQQEWTTGSTIDLGYLLVHVLCGAAALTPSMRDVESPGDAAHALGPLRLSLVTVGVLLAPSVLLIQASRGTVNTAVAIGVISILVSLLMLLRLSMTARAYQRRAALEHAARLASRAMVLASTPAQVRVGAQDALIPLLAKAGVDVRLVSPYVRGDDSAASAPVPVSRVTTDITLQLSTTEAALVFTGPTA